MAFIFRCQGITEGKGNTDGVSQGGVQVTREVSQKCRWHFSRIGSNGRIGSTAEETSAGQIKSKWLVFCLSSRFSGSGWFKRGHVWVSLAGSWRGSRFLRKH
jgi:hypothetical protein